MAQDALQTPSGKTLPDPEILASQLRAARLNTEKIVQDSLKLQQLYTESQEELKATQAQLRVYQATHDEQLEDLGRTTKSMHRQLDEITAINDEIIQSTMPMEVAQVLVTIVILSSGLFLASNLAAMKLLNLGPFPIDGGIFLFPLTYILDDILKEIYGKEMTERVIWINFGLCMLILIILQIVNIVPDPLFEEENMSFCLMMNGMGRIFFASIIAALISRLIDNRRFDSLLQKSPDAAEWTRGLRSSLASRACDMVIFDLIAFYGRVPLISLVRQLILAYVLATILEALFLPVENIISDRLARKLHYRHGAMVIGK